MQYHMNASANLLVSKPFTHDYHIKLYNIQDIK
jgi:hypothetical protein